MKSTNELDLLSRLGAQSRSETQPTLDVTARVIQRIARGRNRMIDPRLAAVSICACVLSAWALLAARPAKPDNDSLASNDTLAALSEAAIPGTGPEALLKVLEP